MVVAGYTATELQTFQRVLDAAAREAAERDIDIPPGLMTRRLFQAAGLGERSPDRLREAILGAASLLQ